MVSCVVHIVSFLLGANTAVRRTAVDLAQYNLETLLSLAIDPTAAVKYNRSYVAGVC